MTQQPTPPAKRTFVTLTLIAFFVGYTSHLTKLTFVGELTNIRRRTHYFNPNCGGLLDFGLVGRGLKKLIFFK